ncbi:hypothetical protein ACHAPQ_012374, partial [Fusarium lateritium]
MSDAAKPMLALASEIELDTRYQSPTSDTLQWREEKRHKHWKLLKSVKNAFKEAWHDLVAAPRRFKSVEWRRLGLRCLILVWSLSLLALTICLALSLPMRLDDESPCQPNGDFYFSMSASYHLETAFSYWAASGFFDITLAWGRFDFATVKLIDVAWDL